MPRTYVIVSTDVLQQHRGTVRHVIDENNSTRTCLVKFNNILLIHRQQFIPTQYFIHQDSSESMAEVAAGALVAEQVVATGVEAGVAAVAIATPTQPLKVSLEQLALPPTEHESQALTRSDHTVTVIGNKAYIFGGSDSNGKLCSTDVYAVTLPTAANKSSPADTETSRTEYARYEAFPFKSAETGETLVPRPRKKHAACAYGKFLVIHGGCDVDGKPIELDKNCLWLWDSDTLQWSKRDGPTQLYKTLAPRCSHNLFFDESQNFFILHGGKTGSSSEEAQASTETWLYDLHTCAWTTVPATSSPAGPTTAAAYIDSTLYTISTSESRQDAINHLYLHKSTTDREKPNSLVWKSVPFPSYHTTDSLDTTTPLAPLHRDGGAALIPLSTGYGRNYLVYMFGYSYKTPTDTASKEYHSSIYTLQVPSSSMSLASAKDAIRNHLPSFLQSKTSLSGSGEFSWAPVDLVATEIPTDKAVGGKVHPGPRSLFDGGSAASSCLGGKGVVFLGGENAKGEMESDGWVLRLAYGYADTARSE